MEFLIWLLITAGFIFAIFLWLFLSGLMHRRGGGDWIRGFIKIVCIIPVRDVLAGQVRRFRPSPKPPLSMRPDHREQPQQRDSTQS